MNLDPTADREAAERRVRALLAAHSVPDEVVAAVVAAARTFECCACQRDVAIDRVCCGTCMGLDIGATAHEVEP